MVSGSVSEYSPQFPLIEKKITFFFLINYDLKTPSVEMTCDLGIQIEIQAV